MTNTVGMKHGYHHGKNKRPDLMTLVVEFAAPTQPANVLGLPDRIVRELTIEEVMDLKKMFDMYDVMGAG